MSNPKYVIAYPFGGRPVPVDWHLAVRSLQIPTNSRVTELCSRGKCLEDAQTSMIEQALEIGAQYILFIEDDTAPPPNTIMELGRVLDAADDSVMACGGIYTTRSQSPEPIVYMAPGEGCFWNWRVGDVFPCWAVGFGCVMLKLKLFQLMPKPWFVELKSREDVARYPELFPPVPEGARTGVSTDMFFYTKLAHMGFKVLAHGGVLPVHWDVGTQTPYWLPRNSPPTQGVRLNGVEYGWTDPAIDMVQI